MRYQQLSRIAGSAPESQANRLAREVAKLGFTCTLTGRAIGTGCSAAWSRRTSGSFQSGTVESRA